MHAIKYLERNDMRAWYSIFRTIRPTLKLWFFHKTTVRLLIQSPFHGLLLVVLTNVEAMLTGTRHSVKLSFSWLTTLGVGKVTVLFILVVSVCFVLRLANKVRCYWDDYCCNTSNKANLLRCQTVFLFYVFQKMLGTSIFTQ